MKFFEILCVVLAAIVISGCLLQPKAEKKDVGQIAFAVVSVQSAIREYRTDIAVEVFLRHLETGVVHSRHFEFKDGERVEYIENLLPGRYLIEEYISHVHGQSYSHKGTTEPFVEMKVKAGKTTLSPMEVGMSAIYPAGGLNRIWKERYWTELVKYDRSVNQ
jgi:hypothetical protein